MPKKPKRILQFDRRRLNGMSKKRLYVLEDELVILSNRVRELIESKEAKTMLKALKKMKSVSVIHREITTQ